MARLANPPIWVDGAKQSAPSKGEGKGADNQRESVATENTEAGQEVSSDAGLLQGSGGSGGRDVRDGRGADEGRGDESSNSDGDIVQGDGPTAHLNGPDGRRKMQQQRWPRRAPEHREALKRALAALWETADDRSGNSSGSPEDGEALLVRGGLKASELSLTVYGTPEASCELEAQGGGPAGLDGEENDGVRRLECSVEDCEEMLLELEAEEMEARRSNGQMDGRNS